MDAQQIEILEQQKQAWNRFSPGWKAWDSFTMAFLKPMGDAIIEALQPQPGDRVLDVATGTGEPGLTIAALVGNGSVTGTDISEGMLQVAQEHAAKKGLSNYSTQLCDVSALPFERECFDAVSCRMGFMFFPDMAQAASEMARVLKPGGHVATSVWAAPQNNIWVTAMMQTIGKHLLVKAQPPGAPGMFRCAAPGLIAGLFADAGLKNITEEEVTGTLYYESKDQYWNNMNEIAAPVVMALSTATEDQIQNIKDDLFQLLDQWSPDGKPALPFAATVICGEK